MKIEEGKHAAHPDLMPLVVEGWNALVQEGMPPDDCGVCPVGPGDLALAAVSDDGDYVGVLVWSEDPLKRSAKMTLAYVEPSSRRKGAFKQMMSAWMRVMRANGMTTALVSVSVDNKPAQAVARQWEIPVTGVSYELAL